MPELRAGVVDVRSRTAAWCKRHVTLSTEGLLVLAALEGDAQIQQQSPLAPSPSLTSLGATPKGLEDEGCALRYASDTSSGLPWGGHFMPEGDDDFRTTPRTFFEASLSLLDTSLGPDVSARSSSPSRSASGSGSTRLSRASGSFRALLSGVKGVGSSPGAFVRRSEDLLLQACDVKPVVKNRGDRYTLELRHQLTDRVWHISLPSAAEAEEWLQDILFAQACGRSDSWMEAFAESVRPFASPRPESLAALPFRDWHAEWCAATKEGADLRLQAALVMQFRTLACATASCVARRCRTRGAPSSVLGPFTVVNPPGSGSLTTVPEKAARLLGTPPNASALDGGAIAAKAARLLGATQLQTPATPPESVPMPSKAARLLGVKELGASEGAGDGADADFTRSAWRGGGFSFLVGTVLFAVVPSAEGFAQRKRLGQEAAGWAYIDVALELATAGSLPGFPPSASSSGQRRSVKGGGGGDGGASSSYVTPLCSVIDCLGYRVSAVALPSVHFEPPQTLTPSLQAPPSPAPSWNAALTPGPLPPMVEVGDGDEIGDELMAKLELTMAEPPGLLIEPAAGQSSALSSSGSAFEGAMGKGGSGAASPLCADAAAAPSRRLLLFPDLFPPDVASGHDDAVLTALLLPADVSVPIYKTLKVPVVSPAPPPAQEEGQRLPLEGTLRPGAGSFDGAGFPPRANARGTLRRRSFGSDSVDSADPPPELEPLEGSSVREAAGASAAASSSGGGSGAGTSALLKMPERTRRLSSGGRASGSIEEAAAAATAAAASAAVGAAKDSALRAAAATVMETSAANIACVSVDVYGLDLYYRRDVTPTMPDTTSQRLPLNERATVLAGRKLYGDVIATLILDHHQAGRNVFTPLSVSARSGGAVPALRARLPLRFRPEFLEKRSDRGMGGRRVGVSNLSSLGPLRRRSTAGSTGDAAQASNDSSSEALALAAQDQRLQGEAAYLKKVTVPALAARMRGCHAAEAVNTATASDRSSSSSSGLPTKAADSDGFGSFAKDAPGRSTRAAQEPPVYVFHGEQLCALLHESGVNLRYLPAVAAALDPGQLGLRQLIAAEVVARAAKHLLASKYREALLPGEERSRGVANSATNSSLQPPASPGAGAAARQSPGSGGSHRRSRTAGPVLAGTPERVSRGASPSQSAAHSDLLGKVTKAASVEALAEVTLDFLNAVLWENKRAINLGAASSASGAGRASPPDRERRRSRDPGLPPSRRSSHDSNRSRAGSSPKLRNPPQRPQSTRLFLTNGGHGAAAYGPNGAGVGVGSLQAAPHHLRCLSSPFLLSKLEGAGRFHDEPRQIESQNAFGGRSPAASPPAAGRRASAIALLGAPSMRQKRGRRLLTAAEVEERARAAAAAEKAGEERAAAIAAQVAGKEGTANANGTTAGNRRESAIGLGAGKELRGFLRFLGVSTDKSQNTTSNSAAGSSAQAAANSGSGRSSGAPPRQEPARVSSSEEGIARRRKSAADVGPPRSSPGGSKRKKSLAQDGNGSPENAKNSGAGVASQLVQKSGVVAAAAAAASSEAADGSAARSLPRTLRRQTVEDASWMFWEVESRTWLLMGPYGSCGALSLDPADCGGAMHICTGMAALQLLPALLRATGTSLTTRCMRRLQENGYVTLLQQGDIDTAGTATKSSSSCRVKGAEASAALLKARIRKTAERNAKAAAAASTKKDVGATLSQHSLNESAKRRSGSLGRSSSSGAADAPSRMYLDLVEKVYAPFVGPYRPAAGVVGSTADVDDFGAGRAAIAEARLEFALALAEADDVSEKVAAGAESALSVLYQPFSTAPAAAAAAPSAAAGAGSPLSQERLHISAVNARAPLHLAIGAAALASLARLLPAPPPNRPSKAAESFGSPPPSERRSPQQSGASSGRPSADDDVPQQQQQQQQQQSVKSRKPPPHRPSHDGAVSNAGGEAFGAQQAAVENGELLWLWRALQVLFACSADGESATVWGGHPLVPALALVLGEGGSGAQPAPAWLQSLLLTTALPLGHLPADAQAGAGWRSSRRLQGLSLGRAAAISVLRSCLRHPCTLPLPLSSLEWAKSAVAEPLSQSASPRGGSSPSPPQRLSAGGSMSPSGTAKAAAALALVAAGAQMERDAAQCCGRVFLNGNITGLSNDVEQKRAAAAASSTDAAASDASLPGGSAAATANNDTFRVVLSAVRLPAEWVVRQVSCGHRHAALLTANGVLLTLGHGADGRLGHGNEEDVLEPRPVRSLLASRSNVMAVACGRQHTLCVATDGAVLACGRGEGGRLGLGEQDQVLTFTALPRVAALDVRVMSVACGHEHSLLVTDAGQLLACGPNNDGQLGLGSSGGASAALEPELVWRGGLQDEQVIAAAGGALHSACVCASGAVYTWGRGAEGQLGHGDSENHYVPHALAQFNNPAAAGPTSYSSAATDAGGDLAQSGAGSPIDLSDGDAMGVACGDWHTLVLTGEGHVMSFGDGWTGQLGVADRGHPDDCRTNLPRRVCLELDRDVRAQQVACGSFTSAAISTAGVLYCWGVGDAFTDSAPVEQLDGLLPRKAAAGDGGTAPRYHMVARGGYMSIAVSDSVVAAGGGGFQEEQDFAAAVQAARGLLSRESSGDL